MAGPAPQPFNAGRLVLIFVGLSILIVGAWLVLGARPEPEPVTAEAEPATEQPVSYYLARGDAARGERVFARCAACHTIVEGGPHGLGPNLWGVMGSPIATRPGFAMYSDALTGRGSSWDWETTSLYLRSPRSFAPGTRMTFAGISNPQDRADVMLYMNRQGGTLAAPAGAR